MGHAFRHWSLRVLRVPGMCAICRVHWTRSSRVYVGTSVFIFNTHEKCSVGLHAAPWLCPAVHPYPYHDGWLRLKLY
jgi:hypothetical protein